MSTNHPVLSGIRIIRPSEWNFIDGEKVRIADSDVKGIVIGIFPTYVQVQVGNEANVTQVYWLSVFKIIEPGDYVEVVGGVCAGRKGSVSGVEGSTAYVCGVLRKGTELDASEDAEVWFL